ncbi:hypothetical protein QOT17_25655 [Balamuthia mandrillaris]
MCQVYGATTLCLRACICFFSAPCSFCFCCVCCLLWSARMLLPSLPFLKSIQCARNTRQEESFREAPLLFDLLQCGQLIAVVSHPEVASAQGGSFFVPYVQLSLLPHLRDSPFGQKRGLLCDAIQQFWWQSA